MPVNVASHSAKYHSSTSPDTEGGLVRPCLGEDSALSYSSQASAMMRSVICDTLKWIEENLENDLHIASLAQRSGYTRWHFQRCFKEIVGRPLSEYVRLRRLVRAADAIMYTHEPLTDIAYDFGYTSQQTLYRVVRSAFGMSPTELRNCAKSCQHSAYIEKELDTLRSPVML